MADIDFFKTEDGFFDLQIDSDGDLEHSESIDTAILMSLFTDVRALPSEIEEASLRRGWFGNFTNDDVTYQIGSKFWLRDQSRVTDETVNYLVDEAKKSLNWMLEDNIISNLEVTGFKIPLENKIQLNINFIIDNNLVQKVFILWENSRFR